MARKLGQWWLLVGLVGCGVSEEDFQDEFITKSCEVIQDCGATTTTGLSITFESQADCESFYSSFLGLALSGCVYDEVAAAACLDDVSGATCAVATNAAAISSCSDVYTGASCGWGTTTTDSYTY